MLAVNYSTIRNHFKDYCDKASDFQDTVIVTRWCYSFFSADSSMPHYNGKNGFAEPESL